MENRIIPQQQDLAPIAGLDALSAHLQALLSDQSLAPDSKLCNDVEFQLTDANTPPLLPRLLPILQSLLEVERPSDPTPLLTLTTKLLAPLPFRQVVPAMMSVEDVLRCMASPLESAKMFGLEVIHKAASSPEDADTLASLDNGTLVSHLLHVWMQPSELPDVPGKASRVLLDLLTTDCSVSVTSPMVNGTNGHPPVGSGRLWHLFLTHESSASIVVEYCTPSEDRDGRQTSLLQGRLLRLLPHLASLNLPMLTSHPHPRLPEPLLPWAAYHMVDKQDVLMVMMLADFWQHLVLEMRTHRSEANDAIMKELIQRACAEEDGNVGAYVSDGLRGWEAWSERPVEEDDIRDLGRYVQYLLS
ncbi:uncharacterized protein J7T54_007211 [Emericellopsis cladophorae]|uniref:Uncharacterized protein n=1 Tax=Emericellopsis cladophorae TaxID=2686198 RepID=A0A9P9XUI3_9HYPO|nr:uncharacterized protein J7T54_007211 [Emericellopsis cladophorae]KAI6777765.1 hypothetical protein J7T54_007211 [Emericellopsis cladophorae]